MTREERETYKKIDEILDDILIEWFNSLSKEEQDAIIDAYVKQLISAIARVIVKNQERRDE